MEELQLDDQDAFGSEVLTRRRLVLPGLVVLVVVGTLLAWRPWPLGTEPAHRSSAVSDLVDEWSAAVDGVVDPCLAIAEDEVERVIGRGARAEAVAHALIGRECRWTTASGTLQAFVAPDAALLRPTLTERGAVAVQLPPATAAAGTEHLVFSDDPGWSVSFEVEAVFGGVGLARPASLTEDDRTLVTALAGDLAGTLEGSP